MFTDVKDYLQWSQSFSSLLMIGLGGISCGNYLYSASALTSSGQAVF